MSELARALKGIEARPRDPHAWCALGEQLLHAGQHGPADEAFSQSIRHGATARGFMGWASCAVATGQVARAVGILTVAWKQSLLPVDGMLLLGELALEAGDLDASEAALAAYTDRQQGNARAWMTRAIVLVRLGAGDRALPMLDRAVLLEPALVDAHANRASVLETLSRLDAARDAAQQALALQPGHTLATLTLARVLRRQRQGAAAVALLEGLSDSDLSADHCSWKYAELGACAEAAADTDRAWQAFVVMNTHARRRPAVATGDSAGWLDRAARIRAIVPALVQHAQRPWTADSAAPPPVFVVGFPRSGTTLLERLLGAHPALVATDEMRVTDRLFSAWTELLPGIAAYPEGVLALQPEHRQRLRSHWFELMRAERPELDPTLRVIDKVPLNLVHLPLLHAMFPESPKVVLLRDPRDTALSCFMQDFAPGATNNLMMSMDDICRAQEHAFGVYSDVQALMGSHLQVVRYESLVADHVGVMKQLLHDMGLVWHDGIADHHRGLQHTHITTPSYARVIQPVDTAACRRWRRYAHHLRPWRAALDQTAQRLGYATDWPALPSGD